MLLQDLKAASLLLFFSVAVSAQPVDTEGSQISDEDDGVEQLIREMREARARESSEEQNTIIEVFPSYLIVRGRRFETVDELIAFIEADYSPQRYSRTYLRDCSAIDRMRELNERKAELTRAYFDRRREAGENTTVLYQIGVGYPPGCQP